MTPRAVHLRAAGTAFTVDLTGPLPHVLHWGADPGELSGAALDALVLTADPPVRHSSTDTPRRLTVWPGQADGWSGTPAQAGHLAGTATSPRPRLTAARCTPGPGGAGGLLEIGLTDDVTGTEVALTYRLDPSGLLAARATLTRLPGGAPAPYDVSGLLLLLPLPARATEILDLTGAWCRERTPQRRPLADGTWTRATRRGRPGHDSPYLVAAGVPGFGFRHGELWGLHVAWSGDQHSLVERLPEGAGTHGAVLGGGELLTPGEIRLAPGASYTTPECWFGWSGAGLDGLADRFHTMLRARPGHPASPRPLILNTWEAAYFDHDPARLCELADRAAEVGVERLVLDDGWFLGRRDDTAGLGDWTVDPRVWPDGLHPLADRVRGHGMQFGLWVEPEMVSPGSRLARAHPDWILGPAAGPGPAARQQYVLDLANPAVRGHLLEALGALVAEYRVDFLKWDHNRDLHEAVHHGPDGADRPVAHAQVGGLYELLDALRERHPGLEIESCASGGGRVDLGILRRTDRVWASDCNDPVERQAIQRWTGQLLPPELVGGHAGAARSHTTGRTNADSFTLATALFGHAGIEHDLTRCTPGQLAALTAWAALYKEFRPLLHSGRVVRADLPDPGALLHGVVAPDASAALLCWARTATASGGHGTRVPLPGPAPDRDYAVRVRGEPGLPSFHQRAQPAWLEPALTGPVVLPGAVLAGPGVPLPVLDPAQALLIELRAL